MMIYNQHSLIRNLIYLYHGFKLQFVFRLGTPVQSSSRLMHNRRTRLQQPDKSVCRLQNSMPLRFREMVVSHLSVLLETQPKELESLMTSPICPETKQKSVMSFSKKKAQKRSVVTNDQTPEDQTAVLDLIAFLSRDDVIATEGIFRKTGNICRQKQLKSKLLSGKLTQNDMADLSPHDCANVLKRYINNLPEPVLTLKLFNVFVKIADITRPSKEETKTAKISAVQLALQLLPPDNLNLLKPLMFLLNKTANTPSNLMSSYSLGILFAPHLLCDRHTSLDSLQSSLANVSDLVTVMIDNAAKIFNTPKELSTSAANFWREMEVPNQLYYNTIQKCTDTVPQNAEVTHSASKVHVVEMHQSSMPIAKTPTVSRKRLSSDTCEEIPEKRPTPEIFLSPDCNIHDYKPQLSKRTNSIIFDSVLTGSTDKPVARVKPMLHSPISQFFKRVPVKIQRVMSTPRSRAPMALPQSPSLQSTRF